MTEPDMETVILEVRLPKGHEPVWVLLVSAAPEPDPLGEEALAVSPQWQPLAEKMIDRGTYGRVLLSVAAVASRGLANMLAVALEAAPVDVGDSWRPRPSRHQREPSGEGP